MDMLSTCTDRGRKRLFLSGLVLLTIFVAVSVHAQDVPSGFLPGNISVFAGGNISNSYTDGSLATTVPIKMVNGLAIDSKGNTYIATYGSGDSVYIVLGSATPIPPVVTAIFPSAAGAGTIYSGVIGGNQASTPPNEGVGGPAASATLGTIANLFMDTADNLYITSQNADLNGVPSSRIYVVSYSNPILGLVAGTGATSTGPSDVVNHVEATTVTLNNPNDAQVDSNGNVYITDTGNAVIRVVYESGDVPLLDLEYPGTTPQKGFIYTVAGQPWVACSAAGACGDGGLALSASFAYPASTSVDSSGNLYILDEGTGTVRVVYAGKSLPRILSGVTNPQPGYIYTVAGADFAPACSAAPCGDGGLALAAAFATPYGPIHVDADGNIYLSDFGDNAVRKVDYSGFVSTVAGSITPGTPNPLQATSGPATSVNMNGPGGVAFDAQNNLFVADIGNMLVWQALSLKPQTITFDALSPVTYGAGPITLNATSSSQLPVSYKVTGPATLSGSTLVNTGAGTVTVTASQAGDASYAAAANVVQTLTVGKATLTVTADNLSKEFGQPNPLLTASYSGFVSPDTLASSVTGQPALSTTATTGSNAGSYPITITPGKLASSNYAFFFVNGTLTITGANPQTITFAPLSAVTYGQTATINLTATASSQLPVQYTITQGTAARISGAVLTILGAGTVSITANQPGNNTYAAAAPPVTQTLVINPAPLTVTGPMFTLPFGSTVDPTTFPAPTITGFVGTDTQALVTGTPQYSTTATSTSGAGSYPIQVSRGTLAFDASVASNYTFSLFNQGTLTISLRPQTITFSPLNRAVYGDILSLLSVSSSGLPITYTLSGPAFFQGDANTATADSGVLLNDLFTSAAGTLTVTATQAGNGQYAAAPPVAQTIEIAKATLYITSNSFTREFGAANPTLTYQIGTPTVGAPGAFVNGDTDNPNVITGIPGVSTDGVPTSPAGTYSIVITAGTLAAPNYNFQFFNGTLTVLPAGSYTITSDPPSLTIPSGQSRQATITITPQNLYQGTVTLSCGLLPANVTCIFSPATYTFTGSDNPTGGANVAVGTLTVNTAGGQTVVGAIERKPTSVFRASVFLLPSCLGGLILLLNRRRLAKRKWVWQAGIAMLLAAGSLGLSSCGSSSGSSMGKFAAPGTSNIVITGAGTSLSGSGSVSSTLNLSVTIQ